MINDEDARVRGQVVSVEQARQFYAEHPPEDAEDRRIRESLLRLLGAGKVKACLVDGEIYFHVVYEN